MGTYDPKYKSTYSLLRGLRWVLMTPSISLLTAYLEDLGEYFFFYFLPT